MYQASTLDFLVCYVGRFIAIETKVPSKKPTGRQDRTMRLIEEAGGSAWLVRNDEDIESLKTFLDHLH